MREVIVGDKSRDLDSLPEVLFDAIWEDPGSLDFDVGVIFVWDLVGDITEVICPGRSGLGGPARGGLGCAGVNSGCSVRCRVTNRGPGWFFAFGYTPFALFLEEGFDVWVLVSL
jgi:hypothetical protein